MKNKLVKIALVALVPVLIIGIANAAQSQKTSNFPRITVANDIYGDRPAKDVRGARMIDGAGNHLTCYINSQYSQVGKQTATEWACWSDKVNE